MTTITSAQDRIVVIGAHTNLGELMIQKLESRDDIKEFWVIDLHSPHRKKSRKLHFIKLDLTEPGADARLAKKLKDIQASVVIHSALKNNPSLNSAEAHELDVIGTLNIASASKAAKVRKVIFCSTTIVYGASSKNPNYLSESHPFDPHPEAHFVRDKIEAEKSISLIFKEAPQIALTILRFCLIVGPRSRNYFTEILRRPLVPTLLGYDPLMQFIHEQDAVRALEKTVFEDHRGVFNIVGKGVIPLSYALREAGKFSLPVASFVAYPLVQVLWNFRMAAVPGRLLDYFRYLWVADGEKAQKIMNFTPEFSSRDAFLDFAKNHRLEEYQWAQ